MKLLILSDLHIGNEGNIFQWNDDSFIEKVSDTISYYEIDAVILNGDVYDLYKYSEKDIRNDHNNLVNFLDHFIHVRGNHDWTWTSGYDTYQITNSKNQIIHFEHGHFSDLTNGTRVGRFVGMILLRIVKKILYINLVKKLYNRYINIDAEDIRRKDRLKYIIQAFKMFDDYDVVCMGHVHKIESIKTYSHEKKKMYLNSGTCTQGKFQGIVFDTETFETILIKELL